MLLRAESESIEQTESDGSRLVEVANDDSLSDLNSFDAFLNFECTVPVTRISVPHETTREDIARQFTLNMNQKAAYMIITDHLDGHEKTQEGKALKRNKQPLLNMLLTL